MPIELKQLFENPPFTYDQLNELLEKSGAWKPMCVIEDKPIKTGKVGTFMGIPDNNGGMPYLRCPSFYGCMPMPSFMRVYLDKLKADMGIDYNIVKVQRYEKGKQGIAPHADKRLDLEQGSDILIYRVNKDNSVRSIHFKNKDGTGGDTCFVLKNNDLLTLPYSDNNKMLHYVPIESNADTAEECISFVFRVCTTFIKDGMIYGAGARFKSLSDRQNADVTEFERVKKEDIILMYNWENSEDLTDVGLDHPIYERVRLGSF